MDYKHSSYKSERSTKYADSKSSTAVESEVERRHNGLKIDLQSSLIGAGAAIAVTGIYSWWNRPGAPKQRNALEVEAVETKPMISNLSAPGESERPRSEAPRLFTPRVALKSAKLQQSDTATEQEIIKRHKTSTTQNRRNFYRRDMFTDTQTSNFQMQVPASPQSNVLFRDPVPYDQLPTRQRRMKLNTDEGHQTVCHDLGASEDQKSMTETLEFNPWVHSPVPEIGEHVKEEMRQNEEDSIELHVQDDIDCIEEQFFEAQDQFNETGQRTQCYFEAHSYIGQVERQTTARSVNWSDAQTAQEQTVARNSRGYLAAARDRAARILPAVQPIATQLLTYTLSFLVVKAAVGAGYERYRRDCNERDEAQQRTFNEQYQRYNEDANARVERMDSIARNQVQDLRGIVRDLGRVVSENAVSQKEQNSAISATVPDTSNAVQMLNAGMARRERRAWRMNKLQTVGSVVGATASVAAAAAACSVM